MNFEVWIIKLSWNSTDKLSSFQENPKMIRFCNNVICVFAFITSLQLIHSFTHVAKFHEFIFNFRGKEPKRQLPIFAIEAF